MSKKKFNFFKKNFFKLFISKIKNILQLSNDLGARYFENTKKIVTQSGFGDFASTATLDELKTFFDWVHEISNTRGIKHIVLQYHIPYDSQLLPSSSSSSSSQGNLADAKVKLLVDCIMNLDDPCLRMDLVTMPLESRLYLEIVKAISCKPNIRGLSLVNHDIGHNHDFENVTRIRQTIIQMMQTNQLIYLHLGFYGSNSTRDYFNMYDDMWREAFARNPSIRQMDVSAAFYEKVCKRNRNYHHKVTSLVGCVGGIVVSKISYEDSDMLCGLYARIQRCLVEIMPTEPVPEKFKETPW